MLTFGRYTGYELQDVPLDYLRAVAPKLTKEANKLNRELSARVNKFQQDEQPRHYKAFSAACRKGLGAQFLDDLRLIGSEWADWFAYVESAVATKHSPESPAVVARDFFREIGVLEFA